MGGVSFAGTLDQAQATLQEALRIHEDRRAVYLAEQAKAALDSLTAQPGARPA